MQKGELLGQGNRAEVFAWQGGTVLKLFRGNTPLAYAQNEFMISKQIAGLLPNVPRVYDFIQVEERHGIVLERIDGQTLLQSVSQKPWELKRYAKLLANLQQEILTHSGLFLPAVKDKLLNDIGHVS